MDKFITILDSNLYSKRVYSIARESFIRDSTTNDSIKKAQYQLKLIQDSLRQVRRDLLARAIVQARVQAIKEDSIQLAKIQKLSPSGYISFVDMELNSANGVEPCFRFVNTSKKYIVAVHVNFLVKNSVGQDCRIQLGTIRIVGTGTIAPGDKATFSWDNDAVCYTNGDGSFIQIQSCWVEFADGSRGNIKAYPLVRRETETGKAYYDYNNTFQERLVRRETETGKAYYDYNNTFQERLLRYSSLFLD